MEKKFRKSSLKSNFIIKSNAIDWGLLSVRRLFKKLGFVNKQKSEKEIKVEAKSKAKENNGSEKLNGLVFDREEKDNNLKGCAFEKFKVEKQ